MRSIIRNVETEIGEKDLLSFTKSVYYLLNGKISIIDTLGIVAQNYDGDLKSKIMRAKQQIEKGVSLHRAFSKITANKEFMEMVKIGEETGNLEIVFKNLYEKYEFNQRIKKDIKNLSIYPVTVIITALVIVFILLKFVVPKFVLIYSDIGQELPKVTQIVINLSKITDRYGIIFLAVIIFLFFILKKWKRQNEKVFEKKILGTKIIGKMYKNICILNFTRNMYSLTDANVPLIQSLKMCTNSKSNILNKELKKIILKIEKGESIQKSFKNTTFFDNEYISFLTIGEKTGEMKISFFNLNEIYYEKVSEKIKWFLKMFEPLSIIFIGVIIGLIVFSVMLPIFKMGEML
ncbi:type II secretion system F family protein [Leptotrichia sp. oral taxon 223]|uniref:type II secretion system F family protein n=1 Tax=Leptotrichia sp. oral taxon 223 TaxID=712363 RepID=UPI0015C01ED6|nr:type II secretion system F family protein [Leptotrichia sp. oral taxon 223]NWO19786.1 type II secretion system F family protein [Leptotrichia sp. oral taxon 223]